MLSRAVADALGQYLDGVDGASVAVSLREGRCALGRCAVRESAWKELGLPVHVEGVTMERLEVCLDWRWNLFESTAQVVVEGLDVKLSPIFRGPEDGERAWHAVLQRLRRRLQTGMLAAEASKSGPNTAGWSSQFLWRLLASASVQVNGLSVKMEDQTRVFGSDISGLKMQIARVVLDDSSPRCSHELKARATAAKHYRCKKATLEELSITTCVGLDSAQDEQMEEIVAPLTMACTVTFDEDFTASEVIVDGKDLNFGGISPNLVHFLHSLLLNCTQLETWLLAKQNPAPDKALDKFRWAVAIIRRAIRKKRRWAFRDEDGEHPDKELYCQAVSETCLPRWVDTFELDCPEELLLRWRMSVRTNSPQSKSNWREWLESIAKHEHDNVVDERDKEAPVFDHDPVRVFWVNFPKVSVEIVDDYNFHICKVESALSGMFATGGSDLSPPLIHFNLDHFEVVANEKSIVHMRARLREEHVEDYEEEGEDDFFDADEGGEEAISNTLGIQLSTVAPVRVRTQLAYNATPVKMDFTVEPLEFLCYDDALARVARVLGDTFDSVQNKLPGERGHDFSVPVSAACPPLLNVRFGAPSFAFYSEQSPLGDPACIIDFGTMELDTDWNASAQSVTFKITVSGIRALRPGHGSQSQFSYTFDGNTFPAESLLDDADISCSVRPTSSESSLAAWLVGFEITPDVKCIVSRSNVSAVRTVAHVITQMQSTYHAIGVKKVPLHSFEENGSSKLWQRLVLQFSLKGLSVVFGDELLRLALSDISFSFDKGDAELFVNALELFEPSTKTCLVERVPVSVRQIASSGDVTVQFREKLCVKWIPNILAGVSSSVFDFTGADKDVERVSLVLQSTMLDATPPIVGRNRKITVDFVCIDATLFKLEESFLRCTLEGISSTLELLPPRSYLMHFSIQDGSVRYGGQLPPLELLSCCKNEETSNLLAGSLNWTASTRHSATAAFQISCNSPLEATVWQPAILETMDYFSNGVWDVLTSTASNALSSTSSHVEVSIHASTQSVSMHIPVSPADGAPMMDIILDHLSAEPWDDPEEHHTCVSLGRFRVFLFEPEVAGTGKSTNAAVDHPGTKVFLNPSNKPGINHLETCFEGLQVAVSKETLPILINCVQNNLFSDSTLLEALVAHKEHKKTTSIAYWKNLLKAKMRPKMAKVQMRNFAVRITDLNITLQLDNLVGTSVSSFIPSANGFQFQNAIQLTGLKILGPNMLLLGSEASFPGFFRVQPSFEENSSDAALTQLGISAIQDPVAGKLLVRAAADNFVVCISAQEWLEFARYGSEVASQVVAFDDATPFRLNNTETNQSQICFELEVGDAKVLVPEDAQAIGTGPCLEAVFSIVGSTTSNFHYGKPSMDSGTLHVELEVGIRHENEDNAASQTSMPESHAQRAAVDLGMTMTESMILATNDIDDCNFENLSRVEVKREVIVKRFTFDITWDVPKDGAGLTQQVECHLTSDLAVFVTPVNMKLLARVSSVLLAQSLVPEISNDDSYTVTFAVEPMGLKLGPCKADPHLLEVRGFGKGCEEHVTKQVEVGDILVEVNGVSLLDESCTLEQVKDRLRCSIWPRVIKFSKPMETVHLDPLLYVPVAQNVWVCTICSALQPLSNKSRPDALLCAQCNSLHTGLGAQASAGGADVEVVGRVVEVEAYENERSYLLVGWSKTLLPGDPPQWSDWTGRQETTLSSLEKLPASSVPGAVWQWLDTWSIAGSGDGEGWQYGSNFRTVRKRNAPRVKPLTSDNVRSRKWVRKRMLCRVEVHHTEVEQAPQTLNDELLSQSSVYSADEPHSKALLFDTSSHQVSITIVDSSRSAPLLRAYIKSNEIGSARIIQSDQQLRVACNMTVCIDVFNFKVLTWEPLLESWMFALEMLRQLDHTLDVTLLGISCLSMNVTAPAIETLGRMLKLFDAVFSKHENLPPQEPITTIRNETGVMLAWHTNHAQGDLAKGCTADLQTLESAYSWHSKSDAIDITIFGGWKPLTGLKISERTSRAFALEDEQADSITTGLRYGSRVIVESSYTEGFHELCISSLYKVLNQTQHIISLRLRGTNGSTILVGECTKEGGKCFLPVVRTLEAYVLHLYLSRENGERFGYILPLSKLQEDVRKVSLGNLAKATTDGVLVSRDMTQVSRGSWALVEIRSRAIKSCLGGSTAALGVDGMKKRVSVGKQFSTFQVSIHLVSTLIVGNEISSTLVIRFREKGSFEELALRSLAPGTSWHIDFAKDITKLEWSMHLPSINSDRNGGWSAWTTIKEPQQSCTHVDNISVRDVFGAELHFNVAHVSDVEFGVAKVQFMLQDDWRLIDQTKFALQAGQKRTGATSKVSPLPVQTTVATIVVVERERWRPLKGWSSPSAPRDPSRWSIDSAASAGESVESLDAVNIGMQMRWVEPEWRCELGETDSWLYATEFDSTKWSLHKGPLDVVRCRKWKRSCAKRVMGDDSDEVCSSVGSVKVDHFQVCLRAGGGEWSSPIDLNSPAPVVQQLEIPDGVLTRGMHPVLVRIDPINRTILVCPRFLLENQTTRTIHVDQCEATVKVDCHSPFVNTLAPGSSMHLFWRSNARLLRFGRTLRSCFDRDESETLYWSGPVEPRVLDEFPLFLRRSEDLGRDVLNVKVREDLATGMVHIVLSDSSQRSMYRIENRTLHMIEVRHVGEYADSLLPIVIKDRRACAFGYEEMTSNSRALVAVRVRSEKAAETQVDFFSDVGSGPKEVQVVGEGAREVQVRVYSEGRTKVLCVTHTWAVVKAPQFVEESVEKSLRVELPNGCSLSAVGNRELLAAHIDGCALTLSRSNILTKAALSISRIQIDDPDRESAFPVMLEFPEKDSSEAAIKLLFSAYAAPIQHGRAKYLTLRTSSLSLQICRKQVQILVRFLRELNVARSTWPDTSSDVSCRARSHLVYFDLIRVYPFRAKVTLSPIGCDLEMVREAVGGCFANDSSLHSTSCVSSLSTSPATDGAVSAIEVVASAISRVTDVSTFRKTSSLPFWAAALDHILRGELRNQRIHLGSLVLTHTPVALYGTNPVKEHYRYQLATELASTALITSEMLRRPVNLVRNIGHHLALRPGVTLSQGAAELVGGTLSISESVFTNLATGLATMSMSNEYLRSRHTEPVQRQSDESLLSQGFSMMKEGVTLGVSGLVTEPVRGARAKGVTGLFSGLGKGVVGAAVKPVVSLLDAATLASQSLQPGSTPVKQQESPQWPLTEQGLSVCDPQGRIRWPRALYRMQHELRPFNSDDAYAAGVLYRLDEGRFGKEHYYGFLNPSDPSNNLRYIVTHRNILCLSTEGSNTTLEWHVRLSDLVGMTVQPDTKRKEWGVHIRSYDSKFICCGPSRSSAETFFNLIADASTGSL